MIDVPEGFLSLARSDDEIAFVLAHGLGHVLAQHPKETSNHISLLLMQMLPWIPFALPCLFIAIPGMFMRSSLFTIPGLVMTGAPFFPAMLAFHHGSRLRERDAEFIGMLLATYAGFDPAAASTIFESLMSHEEQNKEQFLEALQKALGAKDGEARKKVRDALVAASKTYHPVSISLTVNIC